jgi:integrase
MTITPETLRDVFPPDAVIDELLENEKKEGLRKRLVAEEQLNARRTDKPSKGTREKLERGIRRRGKSLVIYLTHPDGHIERRSLGNVTPAFAKNQRIIFQREIAEGKYLKPVPRTEQILFKTIADKAVEHSRRYKRTWDSDEQRSRVFIDWWGHRPADSLTADEIGAKLTENLAPNGSCWSKTTFNEYRNSLSHIFKLAIDRGELVRNPAAKVQLHTLENARTRELSREEEARLRLAIRKLYPTKEVELDLLLHTGARCSNWYGANKKNRVHMDPLQWSAVNMDWKIVTFPRSKAGVGYQLPLNSVAMDALNKLLERSREGKVGPVIRKPSGLELQSCRKWFEESCKEAGIVDLHPHDLRHTFATRLRRNKVPLEDIAALLGHDLKKHSMTARYAHADLDVLREAVNTLVETSTNTDTGTVVEFPRAEAV